MNLTNVARDLLVGLVQRGTLSSISGEILRSWSESGQSLHFGKNARIDLPAANPDHVSLIGADQIFTQDFPNTARTSDDDIDSASAVRFARLEGGGIERNQHLTVPVPIAREPSVPLRISWQAAYFCQRKRSIGWQVDLLDTPMGILFGQSTE